MPSNHLMWGSDAHHVEGVYGATEFTRRCLAEALAEKVEHGELRDEDALHIGRHVMLGCLTCKAGETDFAGPIKVSPNGRYFVDQKGAPFFWLGDTAWPLFLAGNKASMG